MGHRYYYLEDKGDLPDTYNVTLDVDPQRLRQILATLPAWSALFFVSSPCLKNLFSIFVFFSPANLFQLAGVTPFAGGRLYFFSNYKDFNN
ncbi:hypothetical protein [Chitinophaga qingshengii]|uniref:Uncharacterized protein n=1 Tax=Chitinophaga qingshengii TaxID=1569794 RepID=A0ABR7TN49_9BACT|nr:hypothetical protein [Chitinophaga qingshengii]MBC9931060.1 hypothetical protein [Chitinophaga qingshengii]